MAVEVVSLTTRPTRNPTFFDETAGRHLASLEVEIAGLAGQAAEMEREIAEVAGENQ